MRCPLPDADGAVGCHHRRSVGSSLLKMEDLDSPRPFVVSDAGQARWLTDPTRKAFFVPFLARERKVSQAALELGCALPTMLYRVRRMVECGLLDVVREEPRAGKPVKIYRSRHDAYFVPFTATPYDTLEQRLTVQGDPIWAGLVSAYADALRRSDRFGHLLYRGSDHAVRTTDRLPTSTRSGQALFWADSTIAVRDSDARRLGEQIKAWYDEAQRLAATHRGDPAARHYLCVAALLPSKPIRS